LAETVPLANVYVYSDGEQPSMGIRKDQPDGKKIKELRERREMKQKALADDAGISERLLRDIERRNKPVPASIITKIATLLGATAAEITLSTSDETEDASAFVSLLKLRAVRSANELNSLALSAYQYEWQLKVDPSEATAEDMRQVMTILDRLVDVHRLRARGFPCQGDEFDSLPFGAIPRLARLQELLEKLRANGVGVLAGSYVRQSLINKEDDEPYDYGDKGSTRPEVIMCVHFVPSEVDEEMITLILDDLIPF
jgi:transcriptional regulator with XRE-family HTH domain